MMLTHSFLFPKNTCKKTFQKMKVIHNLEVKFAKNKVHTDS